MEELFNILSSSARIDKSKRKKKRNRSNVEIAREKLEAEAVAEESLAADDDDDVRGDGVKSRDRTGKRDTSDKKLRLVHKEQVAAFRRSMMIKLANKHDPHLPDPVSSFKEVAVPSWWAQDESSFRGIQRVVQANVEAGKWKEPTPVQMQAIPALLERRDFIGAAPTGSGKSGAFILPGLFLSSAPHSVYYASEESDSPSKDKKKSGKKQKSLSSKSTREGEIRTLLLAPSLELASQLHREVERLGMGKPGGLSTLLLSKSNATQVIAGHAGGKNGLDILVSTPLRLVDSIEKGLVLSAVRLVVMDEADRLLDAADGMKNSPNDNTKTGGNVAPASGSKQTQTFLSQMDVILSEVPSSATRGLFSATVTPTVRSLAESILRNPVDVTIAAAGASGGANTDIDQELMFVGREEGKLLAIRQLVQEGKLHPPVIIFMQSQERAQALFGELLYDGIHVDVIHAGRSKSARENAVAKFRKGDTWVLICTDLVARGVDFRAVNMVINYDLPTSGITHIHRIGRCGRAGRKGKAITLFTEADFDNLRTIANVMKQSGCKVEDWMLNMSSKTKKSETPKRRYRIDTTPKYDKTKRRKKELMISESKKKKAKQESTSH
jgi:ATP-dependent RNA helicase DDX52/ROK1